jgi:ectoine hydroxylase-related dioxygenase (phytanoyl-CoA dioxygenase family)
MDDAPVMVHNMVRAKPPPVGREKPWHQDLTHFSVHPSATVVSAWIALDDAPVEAGCLHFIPGTHLRGPVGHVYERDYQIPDPDVSRIGQVAAPVRKGGCVFLNALVHHGSPPNRATGRRLALQLTFKPEHAPMTTDQERIITFSAYAKRPG